MLAQKYFRLEPDSRLQNYTDDARRFLTVSDKKYDVIFADLYLAIYSIPYHTLTKEYFELAKEHLTQEGVYIANIIDDLDENLPSLIWSIVATVDQVFDNYYLFGVADPKSPDAQNLILMVVNSDKKINFEDSEIKNHSSDIIKNLYRHEVKLFSYDLNRHTVFTDRYAPIEKYTMEMLKKNVYQIKKE